MDDKKKVGENIRRLRKERDMSQVLLAKAIGISVATLSAYECGKTSPSMYLVERMAEVFATSVDEVLGIWVPDAEDTFGYVD